MSLARMEQLEALTAGGGASQVFFAVTSRCDATCQFCGFNRHEPGPRGTVSADDGRRAIDVLAENGVRILSFTGGEPLLVPHLEQLVRHAVERGLICRTGTNGIRLTTERLDALAEAGLSLIWYSIDSEEPSVHDENRGLPGLFSQLSALGRHARLIGLPFGAGVAMSKLIGDYRKLLARLHDEGYDRVTFAYPSGTMESSYRATSDDRVASFTSEELAAAIAQLLLLKRDPEVGIHIGNPTIALYAMLSRLRGEGALPPCQGGRRLFYLDWDLRIYPCYTLGPLGDLFEHNFSDEGLGDCDACLSQCFRDGSIYYPALASETSRLSMLAWLELLSGPYSPV